MHGALVAGDLSVAHPTSFDLSVRSSGLGCPTDGTSHAAGVAVRARCQVSGPGGRSITRLRVVASGGVWWRGLGGLGGLARVGNDVSVLQDEAPQIEAKGAKHKI